MVSSPPLQARTLSPPQRKTFHGTKSKNDKSRDKKVKDLLLEIEREAKVKLMKEQQQSSSMQSQMRLVNKAKKRRRKKEQNIEAKVSHNLRR